MGTSGSSDGPKGGVPFDPPWLDNLASPQPGIGPQPDDEEIGDGDLGENQPSRPRVPPSKPPDIAPPKRFSNARRALREFVRTGEGGAFRRAVGHYSRTGMGGARNVANRMRASTSAGANIFNFLQSVRERVAPAVNEWVAELTKRNASAQEIADEIVRYVIPTGGSLDEAACQQSMSQALEDLLAHAPGVDLLNLGNNDIWILIESFLGYESFNRLCLDIGQVFEASDFSPRMRVTRMNEILDYLKAELHAQIEVLRTATPNAESGQLQVILQKALENTFAVYEGSL